MPSLDHLLHVDPDKLSDDAAVQFAAKLREQVLSHLDEEEADGGILVQARERGPAYARLATRLEREHRSLRRELGHLSRLKGGSKALRAEIRAVLERLAEHERAERALTILPRRRQRRHTRQAQPEASPMTRLQAAPRSRRLDDDVHLTGSLIDDELGLIAVVEGIGGPGQGDVAAATVIEAIQAALPELRALRADGREPERKELADQLEKLVHAAHDAVAAVAEHAGRSGQSATLVLGLLVKDKLYLAHVGDARAYLKRRDRLRLLTEDHTVGMDAVHEGDLDIERYEADGSVRALSRVLGVPGFSARADLAEVELADGDVLLFCTRGLPLTVPAGAIDEALTEGNTPAETADAVLDAGPLDPDVADDITGVVVHVGAPRGPEQADRVASALANAFLFRDLSEAQRVSVARYLEPRMLETGEILVEAGDPADRMYIVAEGQLLIRKGRTKLVELGPGQHLGELALTRVTVRSATAEAMQPTLVYGLTREDFRRLCVRKPRLGLRLTVALLDFVGDRLRDLTDRVDRDRKARDLRRRVSRSS